MEAAAQKQQAAGGNSNGDSNDVDGDSDGGSGSDGDSDGGDGNNYCGSGSDGDSDCGDGENDGSSVVGRLDMYRTKVLLYRTMVLLARPTKVRC